ncbi:MAG TPA: hypothetical protein VLA92_02960 [Candidatus Saccharimonadales bacterium]|nr:hypothetical protein [Candidatus Saccharimonadales bacterium]
MLVKFLSYVASVLGTARSRAIFVSSFALVLVFTGITAFAVVRDNSTKPSNVSSAVEKPKDTADTKDDTPQLRDMGKQEAKQQATQSTDASQSQQSSSQSSSQGDSSTKQQATTAFDFTLSKTTLTLSSDNNTDGFTANTNDGTAIAWQVIPTSDDNDQIHASITQNNNTQAIVQVQIAKDTPRGTSFKLILMAKDASRNINVQKPITVTVQ